MNLRWFLWDYTDPDLPLTWRQRMRALWRPIRVSHLPRGSKRGRIWFALSMIGGGFCAMFIWRWFLSTTAGYIAVGYLFLWIALMMTGVWFGGAIAYGVFCRREHYHRLRLEGFELCIHCGYWLRALGAEVTKCPECGARREKMPEVKS